MEEQDNLSAVSNETNDNASVQADEATAPSAQEEQAPAAAQVAGGGEPSKPVNRVDKFFGITKSGSNFKTEIIAGITTFMAMVYILMVNAGMFSGVIGGNDPFGAAYIATAIGAVVGTMFMALLARMPLAQASGMGINAFIVFTLLDVGTGLTYANCMLFTLIEGVIFVILTVTGLRKKIFEAIPRSVRYAIPVGIGLFIAFIGMQNAGVIKGNSSTLVEFVSFNLMADGFTYGAIVSPRVALLGVIAIAIMAKKNVKGNILWGILGSAALYYCLTALGLAWGDATCKAVFTKIGETFSFNPFGAFADWGRCLQTDSISAITFRRTAVGRLRA